MTVSTLAPVARRKMQPPAPPDPITQYALDVIAGRVVAGKYVRKAAERHVSDLANGAARGLTFDADAGMKAVRFFGLLKHYEGPLGGQFITLEPWQVFIVGSAFGWRRADGFRRFRRVYVEVAKKNGKTLFASGLALLLAFFDNEPGAQVYSLATKEEQAKLSWNGGVQFRNQSSSLKKKIDKVGNRLLDTRTASFWIPLGRDSAIGDQGINAHGAIIDELHVLSDRDVIDNIETATAARSQPMIIKITTAGTRGATVWEEERADAIAVVEGRATDDTMLVLVYTLDEGDDPFDEAVWPKANPNLDVSVALPFLRDQAAHAKRSPGFLGSFLRYHANIPTSVATRAINIDEWDKSADPPEIPDGATVWGGLDLASVKDLTAFIVLWRDPDGFHHVESRFWCPEDGIRQRSRHDGVPYEDWVRDGFLVATPGDITDYDFVRQEINDLAERWRIEEIGADRWNLTQLGTDLGQDGATVVLLPQTHEALGPAWRELDKLILEHRLRHGGHPILRWMAGNVQVETNAQGVQKPSKARSAEKIDGMVALDMALGRAIVAMRDGPSVYETRGMVAI